MNERHLNVKSMGTTALAQALMENSTLSRYNLSGHEFGHVSAVAPAQGLKENSTQILLVNLNLPESKSMVDVGEEGRGESE